VLDMTGLAQKGGAVTSHIRTSARRTAARQAIVRAIDGGPVFEGRTASRLATELTGDSIGTNILMLGYAAQKGLLPLSIAALEEAIRLNGTLRRKAICAPSTLGRLAAHDADGAGDSELDDTTRRQCEAGHHRRGARQSHTACSSPTRTRRYARALSAHFVHRRFREPRQPPAQPRGRAKRFVREVALTLAKLMAYKDEYEVARLYTDPQIPAAPARAVRR
jgi:indolepyruvate ferredoxin oxidoreductase